MGILDTDSGVPFADPAADVPSLLAPGLVAGSIGMPAPTTTRLPLVPTMPAGWCCAATSVTGGTVTAGARDMPAATANDDDEGDSGRGTLAGDAGAAAAGTGTAEASSLSPGLSAYTANDTDDPSLPATPVAGSATSDRNENDADDAAGDNSGNRPGPMP